MMSKGKSILLINVAVVVAILGGGCGGTPSKTQPDTALLVQDAAGWDAGTDADWDVGPPDPGFPDAGPPDASNMDVGTDGSLDAGRDAGRDARGVDAGPADAGGMMDAGTDTSLPPPPCDGERRQWFMPAARAWSVNLVGGPDDARIYAWGPLIYPTGPYRLGLRATADDPRAQIRIAVRCAAFMQVCADQDDIDRRVPWPTTGHEVCTVQGTGVVLMGISCGSDDPPRSIEIWVEHGAIPGSDPGRCGPRATAEAFEVTLPHFPSRW